MRRSEALSAKQRAFFENNFFGRLTVEIRQTEGRAYFDSENPEDVPWEPWSVISQSGETLTVRYFMNRRKYTRVFHLKGDCYMVDTPEVGFGEWFCRAE